ncbi:Uncharacterized membrane protein [Meinhardsimonia xiamenensis]|jgi:uncharacterized membrane protein|uniref:Uncharacterized membrane protein n=1 Tax=Meinhardsimonia xiamenensis TaxID=990712 RepID=A0A1G9D4B1_9RHOB|nr:DUF2244 domain-containing protein [Meinhardsimonia xiamenensis]PRX38136.1 putative membrane protein [Meinhardsimonia xiamenensis]SDK58721.1 Uncharacterized membrane protein [Meinhardsimonia xiamenensis]
MPARWHKEDEEAPAKSGAFSREGRDRPLAHLVLWPHRSLPRRGFAGFILATFALLCLPLLAVLGSIVLWGLLPFLMGTLALLWYFLERSYRDAQLREDLRLWHDRIELVRTDPRGRRQEWSANPYWVDVELHRAGGPVPNYITLRGGGRQVELGAFLSPEERETLYRELLAELARVKR